MMSGLPSRPDSDGVLTISHFGEFRKEISSKQLSYNQDVINHSIKILHNIGTMWANRWTSSEPQTRASAYDNVSFAGRHPSPSLIWWSSRARWICYRPESKRRRSSWSKSNSEVPSNFSRSQSETGLWTTWTLKRLGDSSKEICMEERNVRMYQKFKENEN